MKMGCTLLTHFTRFVAVGRNMQASIKPNSATVYRFDQKLSLSQREVSNMRAMIFNFVWIVQLTKKLDLNNDVHSNAFLPMIIDINKKKFISNHLCAEGHDTDGTMRSWQVSAPNVCNAALSG